jgi:hypothetical protein
MNMKGKHLVAAVGLLFLFGACEKDIVGGIGDGKKVEIFLSTNITNYHAGADVTRNLGLLEPDSRTIYLNDSVYLHTTLVPDAEEETTFDGSQLRAAAFKEGQKLCFAAFLTNGTQVGSTAVYTYSGGKWTSSNPLGVTPDNSTIYRFVAYSYFDETGTPPTDGSSIDPIHDLVWGMSGNTKIEDETELARPVSISMTHQFARVKVNVNSEGITGADIEALSGVEIDGGQLATLTPFDGGISWSGTVTQGVDITVPSPAVNDISSLYRTVKPVAAGALKVKVGSVKISTTATTFTNQTVAFTPALDAGTSYTLMVNLKKCVWARSNIYWDGTQLTFVPAGNDLTKEGYQGVFFKFGSLVGISGAGDPYSSYDASTTKLYAPKYDSGNWGWEDPDLFHLNWSDIPYVDTGATIGDPDVNTLKGDICKYIDLDYRLPVTTEFVGVDGGGRDGATVSMTMDNHNGTYDFMANGRFYAKLFVGNVVFPASGYRGYGGQLSAVNVGGFYWSGSAEYGSDKGYALAYSLYSIGTSQSFREDADAVRCVHN